MFKFLHMADLHLGYEQYGLPERAIDFAKAAYFAAQAAVKEQVDFVLIAGDIFHNRAVNPKTIITAIEMMKVLKGANIPVVAVAGNHDRGWKSEGETWISLLQNLGYITNLDISIVQGKVGLQPPDSLTPSYVEIGQARIFGLSYIGASLPNIIPSLKEAISAFGQDKYNVLLTHAGIEGEMPGFTMPLRREHLIPLKPYINYLALGHLHKPFEQDNWLYNPGSLETVSTSEARYPGGWNLVQVESNSPSHWSHQVKHQESTRRPHQSFTYEVGFYDTPEAMYDAIRNDLSVQADRKNKHNPLIEITLKGRLHFTPSALSLNKIIEIHQEYLSPLNVQINNRTAVTDLGPAEDDGLTRLQLEHAIFAQAIAADARYSAHQDALASKAQDLKTLALDTKNDPADIFGQILETVQALNLVNWEDDANRKPEA